MPKGVSHVDERSAAHDRFRLLVDERGQAMQRSAYLLTGDW